MTLDREILPRVHEQMARVKAESTGFCTNYFRQEMPGSEIFSAATARTVLLLNKEHDFFRLYFFTTDVDDLEETVGGVKFPGETVTGYLTRSADQKIDAAFQRAGFNPIATYLRMISYNLPAHRPNAALQYANAADVDELYDRLFESFNKYTDHLPTKDRLQGYVQKEWVIVTRDANRIPGAVCFQLEGPRVNYNYLYNLTGNAVDFLRLQNNFYGVMHERGIHAGFLWINETEQRLASVHQSEGWQFDGLKDYFYLKSQTA
jgi:hypothetical protein